MKNKKRKSQNSDKAVNIIPDRKQVPFPLTVKVRREADVDRALPFAVIHGGMYVARCHRKTDAHRLAISIQLFEVLQKELERALVDRIFWKFRQLHDDFHTADLFLDTSMEEMSETKKT